jgi:hypothetical protein
MPSRNRVDQICFWLVFEYNFYAAHIIDCTIVIINTVNIVKVAPLLDMPMIYTLVEHLRSNFKEIITPHIVSSIYIYCKCNIVQYIRFALATVKRNMICVLFDIRKF